MTPMHEPWQLVWAGLAGISFGIFFFGGLWWTLRRAAASRRPALWLASGLFLRVGLTMLGFYAVGAGEWQRLVACLIGFIVARAIVLRTTRAFDIAQAHRPEIRHAP